MQKFGIHAAKHDSCMQYIGVLSRTWITRFEPKMLNIYDISERDIRWRTKTYLERYNCDLNEQFENVHANHFCFIAGIQMFEFDYTMQARNICNGSRVE
ncbi:hypothetical protein MXB_1398, partial [Myxobolus squamalis]